VTEAKPSSTAHHHRREAARNLRCVVITVSDTRTPESDTGGELVARLLADAGHEVAGRAIVKDEPADIGAGLRQALERSGVRAVVLTGMLSYEEIGSAALLSRALAGIARGVVVFVVPGSRGAVRLAMEKLILPEIGHLAAEAVKTRSSR
jgi:molybdenum cofactor biosynthesis protein B